MLIFAFSATVYGNLWAQTSGWETGINLSGGASDYVYTDVSPGLKPFVADIKQTTTAQFYYAAGVYGRKFFKQMYGMELGLQYASFALGSKKTDYTDINGNSGGKAWINVRHGYLELPVRFVFKKDLGTVFSIGCFAGVSPAVLVTATERTVMVPTEGERTVTKESYLDDSNRFNLFADAGLLLRANISQHFALDLKPFFRMSALPIYTDNILPPYGTFKQHYITGGASVSTVWKF